MNRKSIRMTLLLLGAFALLAGGLSACNTVKGAGQDLKAAGGVERKAEQKKRY